MPLRFGTFFGDASALISIFAASPSNLIDWTYASLVSFMFGFHEHSTVFIYEFPPSILAEKWCEFHCWNDGRDINEQWKIVNPVEWNSDIIPFSQIWSNLAKSLGHLHHHCSNVGCGRHHYLLVLESYKRTNRKYRELGTSVFGTNASTILHWRLMWIMKKQ